MFILSVGYPEVATAADAEESGWISAFSRVARLVLDAGSQKFDVSLAPFYGFSSSLESLRVVAFTTPKSRVFNLIQSLPLLEDLTLISHDKSGTILRLHLRSLGPPNSFHAGG